MKGICILLLLRRNIALYDHKTVWIVEHCLDSSRAAVRENIFSKLTYTLPHTISSVLFGTILVRFRCHHLPIWFNIWLDITNHYTSKVILCIY